jgi:hypothetical protein
MQPKCLKCTATTTFNKTENKYFCRPCNKWLEDCGNQTQPAEQQQQQYIMNLDGFAQMC